MNLIFSNFVIMILLSVMLYQAKSQEKLLNLQKKFMVSEGPPIFTPFPDLNIKSSINGDRFNLKSTDTTKSDGILIFITQFGCKVCEEIYPLITTYNISKKTNYTFILISIASDSEVNQIIENYRLNEMNIYNFEIEDKETIRTLGITGTPLSFFVSSIGEILAKEVITNEEELDEFLLSIE